MSGLNIPQLWALASDWIGPALVAAVIGYCVGLVHFRTLETVVRRMLSGDLSAVLIQLARLAAIGVVFWFLARTGPLALLAGSAGVLLARAQVLAGVKVDP